MTAESNYGESHYSTTSMARFKRRYAGISNEELAMLLTEIKRLESEAAMWQARAKDYLHKKRSAERRFHKLCLMVEPAIIEQMHAEDAQSRGQEPR